MQSQRPPAAPRKSAFAAAFFSLLFPGLGHAYLGALVARARVGRAADPGRRAGRRAWWRTPPRALQLEGWVLQPTILLGAVGFLVFDLLYRLFAMLDAWRLARTPGRGSSFGAGIASIAGLLAVLLVLVASHVAIARPGAHRPRLARGHHRRHGSTPRGRSTPACWPASASPSRSRRPPRPTRRSPVEPTPTPEPTPTQGPGLGRGRPPQHPAHRRGCGASRLRQLPHGHDDPRVHRHEDQADGLHQPAEGHPEPADPPRLAGLRGVRRRLSLQGEHDLHVRLAHLPRPVPERQARTRASTRSRASWASCTR